MGTNKTYNFLQVHKNLINGHEVIILSKNLTKKKKEKSKKQVKIKIDLVKPNT